MTSVEKHLSPNTLFGPGKLPGLWRNGPVVCKSDEPFHPQTQNNCQGQRLLSDTASPIESELRPIALTYTLAKVMEGFVRDRLVDSVSVDLDPRQYARAGYSTTDALVYLLQAIYEAVDTGNCAARLFLADF